MAPLVAMPTSVAAPASDSPARRDRAAAWRNNSPTAKTCTTATQLFSDAALEVNTSRIVCGETLVHHDILFQCGRNIHETNVLDSRVGTIHLSKTVYKPVLCERTTPSCSTRIFSSPSALENVDKCWLPSVRNTSTKRKPYLAYLQIKNVHSESWRNCVLHDERSAIVSSLPEKVLIRGGEVLACVSWREQKSHVTKKVLYCSRATIRSILEHLIFQSPEKSKILIRVTLHPLLPLYLFHFESPTANSTFHEITTCILELLTDILSPSFPSVIVQEKITLTSVSYTLLVLTLSLCGVKCTFWKSSTAYSYSKLLTCVLFGGFVLLNEISQSTRRTGQLLSSQEATTSTPLPLEESAIKRKSRHSLFSASVLQTSPLKLNISRPSSVPRPTIVQDCVTSHIKYVSCVDSFTVCRVPLSKSKTSSLPNISYKIRSTEYFSEFNFLSSVSSKISRLLLPIVEPCADTVKVPQKWSGPPQSQTSFDHRLSSKCKTKLTKICPRLRKISQRVGTVECENKKTCSTLLISLLFLTVVVGVSAGPRYSSRIVETQGGAIRGVILEPGSPHLEPVEAFRGVPYAAPPVGELRLRPPEAPLPWSGTRLADAFGAVCPQRPPDVSNRTAALARMPRGRFLQLRRLVPMLRAQSEDCLFLNLYVPGSGNRGLEAPYAVLVFVHGESFEWNSGNPYDGSVLASFGHVIVVTFNFRLGVLGFLRTRPGAGGGGAWSGEPELALMDAVACLRWVAANIAAFGGDPSRVTLLGHDTGAALVNLLLLSGAAAGLFQRAALLSGSALSPWAQQRRTEAVRAAVAAQMGCAPERDLAPCLRAQPLASLMAVRVTAPRFLPAFAPGAAPAPAPQGHAGLPGEAAASAMERATGTFIASELLLGAASTESYLDLNEADVQYGLEEEQRDRVLRTYVRNAYEFHLSEIFSAVRNEYTDWSKPVQHPINLRDAALEALSDGHTVAPLLRVAHLHARRGARTYFFHFGHQTRSSDYPQRLGSVRGEALPYLLGLPLAPGPPLLPHNYSRQDAAVAEDALTFLTNFAKTGNPNEPRVRHPDYGPARPRAINWEAYEPSKQQYLSLTQKPRMRSHYRGHKMALWLNLIPQLHQPGGDDVSMRHHNFRERAEHFYSGLVRAESFTRPPPPPAAAVGPGLGLAPGAAAATECTPNSTAGAAGAGNTWDEDVVGVDEGEDDAAASGDDEAGLLRRLATRHYYSYTAALGVTVGVGCLLLVLNMLVFAGVFYRRRRRGSGGTGSGRGRRGHGSGGEERGQAAGAEAVSLSHCPASAHVIEVGGPPPCYNSTAKARPADPPPPPARTSSNLSAGAGPGAGTGPGTASAGVAGGCTAVPGATATIKKRVQIQEISV